MAVFPSDSIRTKNWGTEILTDADLESQLDLLHAYFTASFNSSTGHTHDGTSNQGPKLSPANMTIASQAQGDVLYASSATVWARLGAGTSGYYLKTQGAGANPIWAAITLTPPPTGSVSMWGGAIASPPSGWLICDGSAVSQATYPDLYAILGTIWGNPGGGNFSLPNFTNKFPYGASEGASAGNASVGSTKAGSGAISGNDNSVVMATAADNGSVFQPGSTSGDSATRAGHIHTDAMPPYLAISFIIKT